MCPIMDARRRQVYTGIYRFDEGRLTVLEDQMAVGIEELGEHLRNYEGKITFLGDGVPVFGRDLTDTILKDRDIAFAPASLNRQRAASVGMLGLRYYQEAERNLPRNTGRTICGCPRRKERERSG